MKPVLLFLAFTALVSETCKEKKSQETGSAIPACVQQRIDSIKQLPRFNPPARVDEYSYKGKRVFLFSSDCCDQFNNLVDEDCQYLCAPTGGITGKGDGLCADFDQQASFVKMVWRDER